MKVYVVSVDYCSDWSWSPKAVLQTRGEAEEYVKKNSGPFKDCKIEEIELNLRIWAVVFRDTTDDLVGLYVSRELAEEVAEGLNKELYKPKTENWGYIVIEKELIGCTVGGQ